MYVSQWSLEAPLKYIVSSQNVLDKIQLFKVRNQRNRLKMAYFKRWTQLIVSLLSSITHCDDDDDDMWGLIRYVGKGRYFTGIDVLY